MNESRFSSFNDKQLTGHCGPCSLSYGLFMLGRSAKDSDQRSICRKINKSRLRTSFKGMDERELQEAAGKFGATLEELIEFDKAKGSLFLCRLTHHLKRGLPALLLTDDFEHWLACVAYSPITGKYVIMDPIDDELFSLWSADDILREYNVSEAGAKGGEASQYFAMLLSDNEGAPAKWQITKSLLKLCARGSMATADELRAYLEHMTAVIRREEDVNDTPLALEILKNQKLAMRLAKVTAADAEDISQLIKDLVVVSEALNLDIPRTVDSKLVQRLLADIIVDQKENSE